MTTMMTKITKSKISTSIGLSKFVQGFSTTTVLKRFSVPVVIIGAALALVIHGQVPVQAQPAPSTEQPSSSPTESPTGVDTGVDAGVDAGSDADAFSVAPSCVNLKQFWKDDNTVRAEATNTCGKTVRFRMIWAWAGDGACNSLPNGWYHWEEHDKSRFLPDPYVSELRAC
jgi:hypothetical protein